MAGGGGAGWGRRREEAATGVLIRGASSWWWVESGVGAAPAPAPDSAGVVAVSRNPGGSPGFEVVGGRRSLPRGAGEAGLPVTWRLFPPQSSLGPVPAPRSEPIARGSRAVGSSRPHLKARPVLLPGVSSSGEDTPKLFKKVLSRLVAALSKLKFPDSLSPGYSETKPTNQTKKAQQISDAGPRNSTSGVHDICFSPPSPAPGGSP